MISNGKVIYEKLDEKREDVEYKTLIDGIDIQILSSPYKKMDRASIIVEGKEVAVDQRGLNIVVIDSKKKSVIDSVVFDTWEEKIGITRKSIKDDYNMTEMEQKHYDVGIFGLWYGRNYGSMVTYFALDGFSKAWVFYCYDKKSHQT